MSPLLKAIGVGIGAFLLMLLLFWGIARLAGRPLLTIPRRPPPAPTSPVPSLPFIK